MEKQVIVADKAPAAVGPYSAGIRFGQFVFTAGQLPIDPATGNLVSGGIEAETHQALTNLQHVLRAAGSSLELVVKTTVFLKNMDDFARMNGVYAEYFSVDPPARSTFQVAALPKGASVEIEAIAAVP